MLEVNLREDFLALVAQNSNCNTTANLLTKQFSFAKKLDQTLLFTSTRAYLKQILNLSLCLLALHVQGLPETSRIHNNQIYVKNCKIRSLVILDQ